MSLVKERATMAHVVVAHLALDPSGIQATSAADGAPGCDLLQ